ncbi:hypothetical protein KMZ68_02110 [Bradyrhizobium sediminis]|uniref:SF3 helicase domain-containing protein n=1 Tax=Bradyrhizobium sediminis TaxID=2840469 RepID=A0A975NPP9_9BRAD|nr:phage/plasmid primase, P4 family [Bradyrhizobium sediminis]QWG18715.1 hypothetical protein KMZ68_02110 [Bradyrhizobium sediminis]
MTDRDNTEIQIRLQVTKVEAPDSEIEFFSEPEHGPAPKHGWDNAIDVAEFKRRCQDAAHFPLANAKGLAFFYQLSHDARDLGISERTAIDLMDRYCTSQISKASISLECHRAYLAAMSIPGVLSRAARANANAVAALVSSDDDNPWTAAVDGDEAPHVWPKPLTYQGKDNASKCAEGFLAERPDKLLSSDGVLYTLEGHRIWRRLDDNELAAEIRATDPTTILDVGKIYQMVNAIHLVRFTKARPFEWIDRPEGAPDANDLILASNGILNLKTGELIPHSGRYFATGLPDWKYDLEATCPLWLEKLGEWLHPSFHATLQEFFGYMLTADTSIEVLLAMIGAKRGGKGTITRIMQALVGKEHHASVMLNDLAGDFGLAGLMDKRAIFIPDAHDADMSRRSAAIERIKSITGNDEVSVNRKNQSMLSLKVPAKIVLVANKHPKFLDESGALADRELVLVFESSFAKTKDTELGGKLKAELSGIANWTIQGLRRLRASGNKFTIGERGRKAQRELAESQSPALRFANESLIVTGDKADFIPDDVLFPVYEHWARSIEGMSARETRNKSDFKNDLMAALTERGVRYTQRRRRPDGALAEWKHGEGVKMRGFAGVKLKAGWSAAEDQ